MGYRELKETTLTDVPHEMAFHLHAGEVISNIHQLADAVDTMPDDQFSHHVSQEHNHFADWVEHVLKNEGLAKDLRYEINSEDKKHFAKTVRDHVQWLENI